MVGRLGRLGLMRWRRAGCGFGEGIVRERGVGDLGAICQGGVIEAGGGIGGAGLGERDEGNDGGAGRRCDGVGDGWRDR